MFFNKKKEPKRTPAIQYTDIEDPIDTDEFRPPSAAEPYPAPLIALIDTNEAVSEALGGKRLKFEIGTLGTTVRVPNNRKSDFHLLGINYDWPSNLHEFDIVIVDLTAEKIINYSDSLFQLERTRGKEAHALLSAYPQQLFDSRPCGAQILSKELAALNEKPSVILIFCGKDEQAHYQVTKIHSRGSEITSEFSASIFDIYGGFPSYQQRSGNKIQLAKPETTFHPLLAKHLSGAKYDTTFNHPTTWTDGKYEPTSDFVPLLLNGTGDIVGFAHTVAQSFVIVLPDIADKAAFVSELCSDYLPDVFPAMFPSHGQFGWLVNNDYMLPGERELITQKDLADERYKQEIKAIEDSIVLNKKNHQFLHELLYQTGDALVIAVETFMRWLGFSEVVNMDMRNPEIREEDLQIRSDKGLLVVEIKGIGGTSTDKDCSQISKIRFRRAKERGKFDVYGLYIVNHQRYMPPKGRNNPPFTENQKNDAISDQRGLLTTYDLYKAYIDVERKILKKEQIRSSLYNFGLIDFFLDQAVFLGVAEELFKGGTVAIITLAGAKVSKGSVIIARKDDDIEKLTVLSIKLDDIEVEEAERGEVGLLLSGKIRKGSELSILVGNPS